MKNTLQAIQWFKSIQGGTEVDRSTFPEQLKGFATKELWNKPTFIHGLQYGVLIALIELYGITPDILKANISNIPYEQYKLVTFSLIRTCLEDKADPFEAAAEIRKELTEKLNIKWEGKKIINAMAILCNEWHNKTPDLDKRAEGITAGILAQLKPLS